jgi:hypothetical protein
VLALDDGRLIRIAEELAMRIEPAPKVLARHEVTPAEYAVLRSTPAFRTHLREALSRWQSPAMAPERIAAKAVTLVESALPGMAGIIEDDKAPAAARVGAFGQIRALSGQGQGRGAREGEVRAQHRAGPRGEPPDAGGVGGGAPLPAR